MTYVTMPNSITRLARTNMQIIDVTVAITTRMQTYPGDPGVEIKQWISLDKGQPANVTDLHFGTHTGTHIDAPAHFIRGGKKLPSLSLDILVGEAHVVALPDAVYEITATHVEDYCPSDASRVLFKTRNSAFWDDDSGNFHTDYTYMSPEAARRLVARGVKLVGIDYLSVERFQPERYETHEVLLESDVVIVEGLDLRGVSSGRYELFCLPLKIEGGSGDGGPARAILRTIQ